MSIKSAARDIAMSLGLIATFLVSFLAIAPYVIDGAMIRDQLVARVADWSGGKVEVRGEVYIDSLFELTVEAHAVSLSDPQRLEGITAASAQKVKARMSVWHLIQGELIFEKIWIDGLEARLAKPVEGDWRELFLARGPLLRRVMADVEDTPFMTVVVRDGHALAPTPEGEMISAVGQFRSVLDIAPDGAGLEFRANFTWRGEPVALNLERGAFGYMADERIAPVDMSVRVAGGEFDANVRISVGDNVQYQGNFAADFADVSRLASLLGQNIGPQKPDELRFVARGAVRANEREIGFSDFTSSLGRIRAKGMISVDRTRPRLQVTSTLDLGALDLLAAHAAAQSLGLVKGAPDRVHHGVSTPDASTPGTPQGSAVVLQALLPVDAPAPFDAELRLSASQLSAPGFNAGPAAIFVSLRPEGLTADLAEFGVFGGTINGQFELTHDADGLALRGRGSADGLSMADCLWRTPARDWMSGDTDATFKVESRGSDLRSLWAATRLEANLVAVDGGAIGVDVAALLEQGESLSAAEGQPEVVLPPSRRRPGRFDVFSAHVEVTASGVKVHALEVTSGTWSAAGQGEMTFDEGRLDWQLQAERVERAEAIESFISFTGGRRLLGQHSARLDIQGNAETPEIRYVAPQR
jgi:hypothetical protein